MPGELRVMNMRAVGRKPSARSASMLIRLRLRQEAQFESVA